MPKVSIIVPVYNTEKYLDKCLKSLISQTLKDIEIIIVNDGSNDKSKDIIDRYMQDYPNIISAYHRKNGGVSRARNFGLNKAKGDYIGFIDSDDYVDKTMYEKLYNKAVSKNFDITVCGSKLIDEETGNMKILRLVIKNDLNDKEKIRGSMTCFYPSLCNKIIDRRLIFKNDNENGLMFENDVWYEDMQWLLKLYSDIKSIGVVKESLYYYLQRSHSITHTYSDKLYDIINNMDGVINYYKQRELYDEYKEELEYLYSRYAFATFMKRLSKSKDKQTYRVGYEYVKKKVNEYYPNYKQNKYLKNNGLKGYYIKYFNRLLAEANYIIEKNKKN